MSPNHIFPLLRRALLGLVLICGLGFPARAAQTVTLGWQAPNDPTVTGYKLYYGVASGIYDQSADAGTATSKTLSSFTPGTTYYFAVVSYNADATESDYSAEITVTLGQVNEPPIITLSQPEGGPVFVAPANVALHAEASDPDGQVTLVQFFDGAQMVGTVSASPYDLNWAPTKSGTHTLTARALDNGGSTTVSAKITVTIVALRSRFQGSYATGVIDTATGNATSVSLTVLRGGAFTGHIWRAAGTTALAGHFNDAGTATLTMGPKTARYTVTLQLNPDNTISVTSTGTNPISLTLLAPASTAQSSLPQAGRYTMVLGQLNPNTSVGAVPAAEGASVVVISKVGAVRVTGWLADGQAFSTTSRIRQDGSAFLAFRPYGSGHGSVAGQLTFTANATEDGQGSLVWVRNAMPSRAVYGASSWSGTSTAGLSRYHAMTPAPAKGTPLTAQMVGGDLPSTDPLALPISVTSVAATNITVAGQSLKLQITPASGLIGGSFHAPNGKMRGIHGVLYEKTGTGAGLVGGSTAPGALTLTGLPPSA